MEKEVTQKIREIRRAKGLSRENMAYELSISTAAYRKVELHQTKLTVDRLFKISEILKTPVDVLLNLKIAKTKAVFKANDKLNQKLEKLYQANLANEERIIKLCKEQLDEKDEIIELLKREIAAQKQKH